MRTTSWAVFLVVALKGVASASAALASPTTVTSTTPPTEVVASLETVATPADADASQTQPSAAVDTKRKSGTSERQVLSKNFPRKPVQIYWFFGGR